MNRLRPSRGQGGGRGGGKPPPGLGGLGGSEIEKERKFGRGSEQKKFRKTEGDLHADPMGRRIIYRLFFKMLYYI